MKAAAVIVAGGWSKRFGGEIPKQFCLMAGKPMLSWTVEKFEQAASISTIVLVVPEGYEGRAADEVVDPFNFSKVNKIVHGGETRQQSVLNGLRALPKSTELVAIHDGARPLTAPNEIDRTVEAAARHKAAILGAPVADTIKRINDQMIVATLDRTQLFAAQTPQVFDFNLILEAHTKAVSGITATDDAELVEYLGVKVQVVESLSPNFKITTESDMRLALSLLHEEVEN